MLAKTLNNMALPFAMHGMVKQQFIAVLAIFIVVLPCWFTATLIFHYYINQCRNLAD